MGEVYRARDTCLERAGAIEVLPEQRTYNSIPEARLTSLVIYKKAI